MVRRIDASSWKQAGAASPRAFLPVAYVRGTLPAVRRLMEVTGLVRGLDRLLFEA
jgi:hypothetical protein